MNEDFDKLREELNLIQVCSFCNKVMTTEDKDNFYCNKCYYWEQELFTPVTNSDDDWSKRQQSAGKKAEELFELNLFYLQNKEEYKDWLKTGTSPHEHNLNLFYIYSYTTIDPDYIVYSKERDLLYLVEVKGTKKFKVADYEKLTKLYEETKQYDKAKVGVKYINTITREQYWWSYSEVKEQWDKIEKIEYYKNKDGSFELDALGNKKPYKTFPFDKKNPNVKR